MFELSREELEMLRSEIGTSSWDGVCYAPMAFIEQGVPMLSGVLKSERAVSKRGKSLFCALPGVYTCSRLLERVCNVRGLDFSGATLLSSSNGTGLSIVIVVLTPLKPERIVKAAPIFFARVFNVCCPRPFLVPIKPWPLSSMVITKSFVHTRVMFIVSPNPCEKEF